MPHLLDVIGDTMTVWSKFISWLSGWPESKEERIKTYAEEREEQKKERKKLQEARTKRKKRKQGNLT